MPADNTLPLVTIAIPTYNRVGTLSEALASAQNQSYKNLEIIVSDNCSTDDTQAFVETAAQADRRINYIRHKTNIGAVANFSGCLDLAKGNYYMWLADDDFLSPNYVEEIILFLLKNPDYVLAAGVALPFPREALSSFQPVTDDINAPEAYLRCQQSYRASLRSISSFYYGIARTEHLKQIPTLTSVGSDLIWTSELCLIGKIKILEQATWNFRLGGTSASLSKTAKSIGLSPFWVRFPALNFAYSAAHSILFSTLAKKHMKPDQRAITAMRVALLVMQTHNRFFKSCRQAFMNVKYKLITCGKKLVG